MTNPMTMFRELLTEVLDDRVCDPQVSSTNWYVCMPHGWMSASECIHTRIRHALNDKGALLAENDSEASDWDQARNLIAYANSRYGWPSRIITDEIVFDTMLSRFMDDCGETQSIYEASSPFCTPDHETGNYCGRAIAEGTGSGYFHQHGNENTTTLE